MNKRTSFFASILFTLIVAVGASHLAASSVIRRHVLDSDTYRTALVEADVFDRIYTEILADPAFTETVSDLLGRVEVDPALAPHVASTTTNALRWALPPDRIRAGTDVAVDGIVEYLRGDRDRLVIAVPLADLLDRVDEATATFTRTLLDRASTFEVETLDEYQEATEDFVSELTAGRVPAAVPVFAGSEFDPEPVVDAVLDAVNAEADPAIRSQVAASMASGDPAGALTAVAADAIRPYVESEVASIVAEGEGRFDVVGSVTERARERTDSARVTLEGVQNTLGWFGPGPQSVSAVLVVVGLGGLIWTNRRHPRRFVVSLGVGAAAVALLFVVAARVVAERLLAPIEAGSGDGPGSWNLQPGLRSVLGDLGEILGTDLRSEVLGIAGAFLIVAIAAGAATLALTFSHRLRSVAGSARALVADGPTLTAGAACVVLLVGAGVLTTTTVDAGEADTCNGHSALCDRPYDEVVYAMTHNSMSSPDVVKVWPEQDGDLTAQLEAGVRGLMIDSHYWRRIDAAADLVLSADESSVPITRPVAEAVLATAGELAEGREGTFLCHNECVFGAMGYTEGLVEVREFLEANPREVVTLIVQDEVDIEDTVAAFEAADVEDLIYDGTGPWPTLGELISSGERLIVFGEQHGGSPVWYRDAWEAMQDTPFGFESVEDFSCDANRGAPDASLLLVNHWVSRLTPSRQDAALANTREVIVDRARRCERERGQMVNFIGVDFYNIGDVVGAADELNGVG